MANTAAAWVYPDAFVGRATISAYEPYPLAVGSSLSSRATNVIGVVKWHQPAPIAVSNIVVQNSMNAIAASATSQASSGSEGYSYAYNVWLFSRQDFAANSSQLSYVTSGSFGLSASLSYTSTAQSFGMSWVTNTTGGTSNLTTTSNDAGWSAFATGYKVLSIPFVTTLTAGEWWLAVQNASTTLTSNSNITLLSMSLLDAQLAQNQGAGLAAGLLGQSVAVNLTNAAANNLFGQVIGTPTTSATMALTLTGAAQRGVWFALSNA